MACAFVGNASEMLPNSATSASQRYPMNHITRAELRSLVTEPAGPQPQVSIYVPLHRAYPESQANPAVLREAVDQAERRLAEYGLNAVEARRLVQPARDLEHQRDLSVAGAAEGLAVLLTPESGRHWRLPYPCPTSVDVGPVLYLAPLVRMLTWPVNFFLLTLSANGVHLFRGTREALTPVELPAGVPHSLAEFTAGTQFGRPVSFRTAVGVGAAGASTSVIHGQASSKDDAKSRVDEYVKIVAKGVGKLLRDEKLPLVLAATERVGAAFRQDYAAPELVEPTIHGSPDELTRDEMHQQAVRLVEARHEGELKAAGDRFRRHAARISRDLEEIVPAACQGRVDSIIAAFGERVWGTWNAETQLARTAGDERPNGPRIDLLDLSLQETLRHDGHVCVVPREHVPDGGVVAAVLRW